MLRDRFLLAQFFSLASIILELHGIFMSYLLIIKFPIARVHSLDDTRAFAPRTREGIVRLLVRVPAANRKR